ncbi:hypothetical protein ACCS79_03560 [Rhizobium johnstonii]|uniref:hypothetical protein n=1 Tax=Rhizobium johnstonii TaxID=3019933 RepID=UPI003F98D13C
MATAREIKTRFSLDGLKQVQATLRAIGDKVADFSRRVRASVRHLFAGAISSLKDFVAAMGKVAFHSLLKGAKLAFTGIAVAATATAFKVAAIGTAAIRSTKEMAENLRMLNTLSKQTGASVSDISTLRFAAEQNGGDPDELLPSMSTVAQTFGDIKTAIDKADDSFQKTRQWNLQGVAVDLGLGDSESATGRLDEIASQRLTSLSGIRQRIEQIKVEIGGTEEGGEQYNQLLGQGFNRADIDRAATVRRLALVQEAKQLQAAEEGIRTGFGPAGEALESLEKHGLDIDKFLKGSLVDQFYDLADALNKVSDGAEKLRIAQQVFGGDAGAKNLALLQGGRAAIDRYRNDQKRFGALETDEDGERGAALKRSEGRRGLAIKGLQLDLFRQIDPLLEKSNDRFAEWIARNRDMLVSYLRQGFIELNAVFFDVLKLIEGDHTFESTLFKKGRAVFAVLQQWYSTAKAFVVEVAGEFQKVLSGGDSDWKWLNKLRDAFLTVKQLAEDTFAVFTGGDAEVFTWMNSLRDAVESLWKKLSDAFDMFVGVVKKIHEVINPVIKLFTDIDPTTLLLFLGMTKFSGLLGGILKTVGLLGTGFAGLFAAVGGKADGLVSRVSGSFTGLFGKLSEGVTFALGKIGLFGTAIAGAYVVGKQLADWANQRTDETWGRVQDKIAETMRLQDNAYLNQKAKKSADDALQVDQANGYNRNYHTQLQAAEYAKKILAGGTHVLEGGYNDGKPLKQMIDVFGPRDEDGNYRVANLEALRNQEAKEKAAKTVNLNFNVGGRTIQATTDERNAAALAVEAYRINRMGN